MKLYPYQLWVGDIDTDAVQSGTGTFAAQTHTFSLVSTARDVVNSAGATVTGEDQTAQVYDFLIVLPKRAPDIAVGASVEVRDGNQVRAKGTVKRFYRGQLSCRVWV